MMAHPNSQFPFSATVREKVVAPIIKAPGTGDSPHVFIMVSASYIYAPITVNYPIGQ